MNLRNFFFLFFLAVAGFCSASALAEALDIGDVFSTQQKIANYGDGLRPETCPKPPAANAPLAEPLTLGEVVVAALCHNPDARVAYLSLLSSKDSYDGTLMSFLPDISASSSAASSRTHSDGSNSISRSSGISASSSMTIYDFGRRETSLAIAERTLVAAGLNYDSALQGFIASSLQAYFSLLTAQNAIGIEREAFALSAKILDAAEVRYSLGLVPLADVLQARTSHSQAEITLKQADNTLSLARAALAQQMGMSAFAEFSVAELDDLPLMTPPFKSELLELVEKAKSERVDLKTQRLSLKNAEDSLRNTKRRNLPSISATASSSYGDWDIINRSNRTDAIGVSVSIPIFTGFGQIFSERSERKQLESQRLQLVQAERSVEQDVMRSWQNYNTARMNLTTSQSSLESARLLKDVSIGRYQEGIGSILDVLGAQVSYRNSLQSLLSSRYNLLTTRVDLIRSVGELDLRAVEPKKDSVDSSLKLSEVVTYKAPDLGK